MIACVLINEFAVAAHPGMPRNVPLVFLDDTKRRAGVAAMSTWSQGFGVERGMSRSRVQALCPNALVLSLEPARIDVLLKRVLNTLWTYTNRIEVDETALPQTGTLFLDLGRTTDVDASTLGQQMRCALSRLDIPSCVGLAHGKFTAHAVALSLNIGDVCVVQKGTEAGRLASLPIGYLPLTKDAKRILAMMNIQAVGEFATLPRSSLVERFGRQGQFWHQLASGADYRAIRPQRLPEVESVSRDFDDPIVDVSTLERTLDLFASSLASRLDSRGSAAHEFTLTVHLEGGAVRREKQTRAAGLTTYQTIRTQLYDLLDRMKLDRSVAGMSTIAGQLQAHTPCQLDLFSYRPAKQAMIDLAQILVKRHGGVFYTIQRGDALSLLPEEHFQLRLVETRDAS